MRLEWHYPGRPGLDIEAGHSNTAGFCCSFATATNYGDGRQSRFVVGIFCGRLYPFFKLFAALVHRNVILHILFALFKSFESRIADLKNIAFAPRRVCTSTSTLTTVDLHQLVVVAVFGAAFIVKRIVCQDQARFYVS